MAVAVNPFTFSDDLATFLASSYDDVTYDEVLTDEKTGSALVNAASLTVTRATTQWGNLLDSFVLAVYPLMRGSAKSVLCRSANSAGTVGHLAGTGSAAAPQILTDNGTALTWTAFSTVRSNASVLYEVDFSTLANNTFVDGAETIDGLAYVAANMAELGTAAVQNGTGIRMVAATSNGGAVTMTSASQLIPYIYVPLSQIAGYDPTADYMIEIYMSSRVLEANGEYVALGLWGVAASPFGSSDARMRAAKLVRNAGDTADVMRVTTTITDETVDQDISTHNVMAIKVNGLGQGQSFSGIWSAGWPTSYTPGPIFPTALTAENTMNDSSIRIFMGLGCANDASPTTAVTIERMRIRKVS